MPQLMDRLGIGEEFQRRSCRSPFREERRPSFGIFQHDGRWFWKDHGVNKSGDEISLIMEARGFDKRQAIEFYRELVGAREATSALAVEKLDQSNIDEISLWRGYKPLTVSLLNDLCYLIIRNCEHANINRRFCLFKLVLNFQATFNSWAKTNLRRRRQARR